MSGYRPQEHEARARFIAGSIDIVQRRDGCTLAEAEEIAILEWQRWLIWHNTCVRRLVAVEDPEWIWATAGVASLRVTTVAVEAQQWLDGGLEVARRRYSDRSGPWVPVKQACRHDDTDFRADYWVCHNCGHREERR